VASQTTGRHRPDGGRPSGNSKNSSGINMIAGTQLLATTIAASSGTGSDPGRVNTA
jgi:hypothetical protein